MSRFFIDRPVFAWVIAIAIMLVGILSILTLPITQYPTIAPPAVNISAFYPGASPETVQNSVTQIIEQQLTGLDNLLYFSSSSSSAGGVSISATFAPGTNADIAQVQVQNRLQQAVGLLPPEVVQEGISVTKSSLNFLLVLALYDTSGHYTDIDIADYLYSRLHDPLARVPGVGDVTVFGAPYAMRIWLNPYKLATYGLMPSDVSAAVTAQNVQVTAGELGAIPAVKGQELDATVTAQSQLQTPQQFRNIILKGSSGGAIVRLGDVARVELGSQSYGTVSRFNGHPSSGLAIRPIPGANALKTADAVQIVAQKLAKNLPPGLHLDFVVDNTKFIRLSIHDVVVTLIEAIGLVILVMFVFLQNWRTTLIPAIAVPVVLLGTFGVLAAAGYSINTLTLFALVLAIGLLVDDAIVVVENVERIMRTEGLSPREATIKSMEEITGALIGIALVLSAVFLPMAFFGGSTGIIYRQFSITIVSAMVLSIIVALVLTPALCATLLKPVSQEEVPLGRRFFRGFNTGFDNFVGWYRGMVVRIFSLVRPAIVVYVLIIVALVLLFFRLPTSFLPEEDQGIVIAQAIMPAGAVETRTLAVLKKLEHHFMVDESKNTDGIFTVAGFSFSGQGQNTGIAFIHLKDWNLRKGEENHAAAIATRTMGALAGNRDGMVFALVLPAVPELGVTSGFDLELEDRGNLGHAGLIAAEYKLLGLAAKDPLLAAARPSGLQDTPQLHVDIDQAKANALGLSIADINNTLSAAWGSVFINQFLDRGRVKQVYMEGDAPYRMKPDDLDRWYVRGQNGEMAPFASFANSSWMLGPAELDRYNGLPAVEVQGQAAPGKSSGAAMNEMERLITTYLPHDIGFDWSGLSYQERLSGSQAPALYGISILVVFLCLAALYESWSIPFSVLLVIPLGVIGAVLAATLRGFYNDIYFQVGLLATIGLSAKNAILIVEFAATGEKEGRSIRDSALHAAQIRLRPILMTSLAFIAGVMPLAISTGAGAASQNDIGTGVIGGMFSATVLAIFFVPLFFLLVRSFVARRRAAR
ncbi:MAG TPA: efflux RND transporter permease subunit [Rhizomicrobium sp.]|jgi:multidrug efflux pump|nr:efflux RND transporter permease subunit [Rhizomicrobium sp.]